MKPQLASALDLAPLFLAGCATSADTERADAAEIPSAPSVEPATAEPTTPSAQPDDMSPRGNTITQVADFATLRPVADPDCEAVTFAITDIAPDFACTSPYAEPPKNGHFVALTMDIETGPEPKFSEYLPGGFYISNYSFKFVTPEGTTANDVSGNAYMCLNEAEQLPAEIGGGEKVTGRIVLDVPSNQETIIYEDMSSGEGWEWEIPVA